MRKIHAVILTTLLLLTLVGTQLNNQAKANPYLHYPHFIEISPPAGTEAPIISIHTPQNGSSYPRNVIPLTFDVIIPHTNGDKSIGWIDKLNYKASWEPNEVSIAEKGFGDNTSFSIDLYITCGGNLSLTIYAVGIGEYHTKSEPTGKVIINEYYDRFEMNSSSTVSFNQDFFPPKIAVLSPQNCAYDASGVELSLAANEALSQVLYCLDGNQNQTITGNVTLTGLATGAHNITFYATDLAGYTVASETRGFTITEPEPFPTVVIAAVILAVVVFTFLSLLYYRRHRKNR